MFVCTGRAWVVAGLAAIVPASLAWAEVGIRGWVNYATATEGSAGYSSDSILYQDDLPNPYVDSLSQRFGDTSLGILYNFIIDEDLAVFSYRTSHALKYIDDESYSLAAGGIGIQPTQDVIVAISGSMSCELSVHENLGAGFSMSVREQAAGDSLYSVGASHEGEGVGGVTLDASTVIPAGETYSIGYRISLETQGFPEAGATGTAISDVTITISAVPEPAAALLLAFGAPAALARRRRG